MNFMSQPMLAISACLSKLLPARTYQSELDYYISKKCPKDAADIERYTREFEYKISQGKFI